MKPISIDEVRRFVSAHIGDYHETRIEKVKRIKLAQVLQKKNPYLFKAKNILTAEALVRSLLQAFLSSSEEALFGDFLEELAIFVAAKTYGGRKSSGTGLDMEFERDGVVYLFSIKSGVNWGNSSQYSALKTRFKNAVKVLRQSKSVKAVQPVLASCYGKRKTVDNGEYLRICGQEFWYFISGSRCLYTDIIEPLGHQAKHHNLRYEEELAAMINKLTEAFSRDFCDDGKINWKKLVEFNSGNLMKA